MADREKVIKAYEDFVNGYECLCTSDDEEYEMHKAVLALLKDQDAVVPLTIDDAVNELMDRHYDRLKEQEAKWVEDKQDERCRLIKCSNCGLTFIVGNNIPYDEWIEDRNYCRRCGARMVKRNDQTDC